MTFVGKAEERTDAEFRSGQYAIAHQKHPTPLLNVKGFDMVKTVTVAGDLHLLHIIMKRLLEGYVDGNLTPVQKWTVEEQKEISDILVRTSLPVEIHRVMRSLKYLKYWKGFHYDKSYVNSNVHNLLHIGDDVQAFGSLPTLSSYPFEGKLQFIK
uniref:Uncharacterized protein n=1 Tax=Anopheles funestus TaxID=62324 RepID=A0A182RLG5_ANOFN